MVSVLVKISVTWLAILSLVALLSPQTAWYVRVLWGRWRGTMHTISDMPDSWKQRVRMVSALILPVCGILMIYWVRALPLFATN